MASGEGAIAAGAANASGYYSMAIGVDRGFCRGSVSLAIGGSPVAGADASIALGNGVVGDEADDSIAIGTCEANHPGQVSLGRAPNEFTRISLNATTTNAAATAVLPIVGLSAPLAVPDAEVWYIKARVMGTVFDGSNVPTKVIVRELSCIARSTGMLGSLTASSPFRLWFIDGNCDHDDYGGRRCHRDSNRDRFDDRQVERCR